VSERSAIEWTDATWNPWHGCLKVSPGCKNCFMYTEKARYGQDPATVVRSRTKFNDPLKWARKPATCPKLCFTCSWSDFFIAEADAWRPEAWSIIKNTPGITYQILTKRPERIAVSLPDDWGAGYPNVWLCVSAETQRYADERTAHLRRIPAKVRGISAEPLLGPIDCLNLEGIGWVIVGGESGPGARPMHIQWAESIVAQCAAAGVPCFVKQLGSGNKSWHDGFSGHRITGKGGNPAEWPENLRVREYPVEGEALRQYASNLVEGLISSVDKVGQK